MWVVGGRGGGGGGAVLCKNEDEFRAMFTKFKGLN